jgi:hypothetical protein
MEAAKVGDNGNPFLPNHLPGAFQIIAVFFQRREQEPSGERSAGSDKFGRPGREETQNWMLVAWCLEVAVAIGFVIPNYLFLEGKYLKSC